MAKTTKTKKKKPLLLVDEQNFAVHCNLQELLSILKMLIQMIEQKYKKEYPVVVEYVKRILYIE